VVRPEGGRGVVRDLGYRGLAAELERPRPLYSELKLAFDLSVLGFRASDVYGRVVSSRESDGRFFAGVEFTSLDAETQARIELFVQMLLQGEYREIS
jgi:adenylate cyclase